MIVRVASYVGVLLLLLLGPVGGVSAATVQKGLPAPIARPAPVPALATVSQKAAEPVQATAQAPVTVTEQEHPSEPAASDDSDRSATATGRSWLRNPAKNPVQSNTPEEPEGVPLSLLALVLLGGLAGGAVVMRLRRSAPAPWLPPPSVRVLSTTRIGPKANLVSAEVYGRVLLLGVTEDSVSELGWVDAQGAEAEPDIEADEGEPPRAHRRAEPQTSSARGFGQVFSNVFGKTDTRASERPFRGNPNVAALIAARDTQDVVSTSYSRATAGAVARRPSSSTLRVADSEPARVETQVAGLMRRRR